jgi:hypothetical protein
MFRVLRAVSEPNGLGLDWFAIESHLASFTKCNKLVGNLLFVYGVVFFR